MEKRGRGRPPKPPSVAGPELARLCLFKGYREIMEETGLGQPAAQLLTKVSKMSVQDFVEEQRPVLQDLMGDLLQKAKAEMAKLSPMQAYIAYGILRDKHDLEPKNITNALHIHLKGGDPGSALKAIFGPSADSISSAAPSRSNNASRSVDVTATQVPDATTDRTSDSKSPASKP